MLLGAPAVRLPRVLVPFNSNDRFEGKERRLRIEDIKGAAIAALPRVNGQSPPLLAAEEIDEDQWTLNRYRQEQPIFRFAFGDPERSVLYVSGASGRVAPPRPANASGTGWGAIPHWLYFESLGTDGLLWSCTVTLTSILGSFLTMRRRCQNPRLRCQGGDSGRG